MNEAAYCCCIGLPVSDINPVLACKWSDRAPVGRIAVTLSKGPRPWAMGRLNPGIFDGNGTLPAWMRMQGFLSLATL